MPPRRMIAFDVETAVSYDHIVEIGCVEVLTDRIGRSYHTLVRPVVFSHPACYMTHGLSDSRLAYERSFAELIDDFADFVGDAPFLCHNASYEKTVLRHEMDRLKMIGWQDEDFLCTLKLARRSGYFQHNGLRPLCDYFDIDVGEKRPGRHDALSDAIMCAEVYLRLYELGFDFDE